MMTFRVLLRSIFAIYFLALFAACSQAQSGKPDFQPQVGQEGKDVIWVPTPQALVDKMLDIAKVTPKDYVIDLGSGDGRTVITAAKRGIKALGIEYNPDMVELSKRNAAKEGVSDRASFMKADLFETDFSQAHRDHHVLVARYQHQAAAENSRFKARNADCFQFLHHGRLEGDDTVVVKNGCASYCTAHLWIVPAKVEGTWQLGDGELTLKQTYQMISGSLNAAATPCSSPTASSTAIRSAFNAGGSVYTGRVSGNGMEGTISSGGNWQASRSGK